MTASREALLELQRQNAFDPVPLRAGLHSTHIPFDRLTGSTNTEAELTRCMRGAERVAIAGRSGVGKTSLIGYVCAELADEVAPLRVPVDAEDDDTVTDPAAFCRHLIRTLARHLADARAIDDKTRTELLAGTADAVGLTKRQARQAGLGLPKWMLQADVARDAETAATATFERSAADHIAQARDVIEAVAAHDLIPMIVIDDSDAWLATAVGDRSSVIAPFFSRVMRVLAEELRAGIVVAVHDRYFDLPEFPRGRGFLEQVIHVPGLPDVDAVAAILAGRTLDIVDLPVDQIVATDAIKALHDGYQLVEGNIRTMLLLAHTALQTACEDDAEHITHRHVEIAMTRFRDVPG
ncbi:MAG TPA: hypothetical protein VNA20_05505 [Frankiaceae bacterium]|nr:hypothetical protein [Frankiaceae bacterium]